MAHLGATASAVGAADCLGPPLGVRGFTGTGGLIGGRDKMTVSASRLDEPCSLR